jgi:hypothetical protein
MLGMSGIKTCRTCSQELPLNRFAEGTPRENYGERYIDHIAPSVFLDLLDAEQPTAACHCTNLQPLWGPDNISRWASMP